MFKSLVSGCLGAALLAFALGLALMGSAQAQSSDQGKFVVDGLPLGGKVRTDSPVYKQYNCTPSSQYRELIFCKRVKSEAKSGSSVTTTTTILHAADGTVVYVNQFVEPATFSRSDIDVELGRLSAKYGEKARVQEAPKRSGIPQALIATWGSVNLQPLPEADLAVVRGDRSPGRGILADFLGDFARSAQAGLPVFSVQGEFGYVWAANFDVQGRGTLRFFAINAARLKAAFGGPEAQEQRMTSPKPPQPSSATLARQLDECGESCPDKPELDKLRRDTLDQLEQARTASEDADKFAAAIGDEQALIAYITACDKCSFRAEAQANLDVIQSARTDKVLSGDEERQYRAARGNIDALKQYVAQCKVCAFARDAVSEIDTQQSNGSNELFDVEVCSKEYLPVYVAFAGRPDPNSDMWTSEGWYKIDSGECKTIAKLRKGNFFLTAHNKRANWEGTERYCTVADRAFTVILMPDGGDCLEDEQSTSFEELHFDGSGSKYTWRLNAKPWSYTALAYSPFNNSWGWSGARSSSAEAVEAAIAGCSKWAMDCRLARWVRDDLCLTLAEGQTNDGGTALGWATGADYSSARQAARQACSDIGYGCVVTQQSCSP